MANKRLYDEKTGEGWAKVAGKWQYFRDGKILDLPPIPGLRDADQRLKTWRDTTKKKVKKAVEPHVEQVKKGFLLAGESIQDTSKQVGKGFQIAAKGAQDASKKYVTDPVNKVPGLWKDLGDRTIGSGEFNDKGKELSVFELRRQNEKYRNQLETESLEEIKLPDGSDFYSIAFMDNYTGELGSDYNKTWEGVDTSNFDAYQNINFKNAMSETYWLTEAVNGPTYSLQTKENSYTNLAKSNDLTQMGGTPSNATATIAEAAGLKTNDTPSYIAPVVSNQSSTAVDSATANLPAQAQTRAAEVAKADPKVTQWYDLEGEDGGEAAKQMARQKLADQKVEVKPEDIQTNQAVLPTGTLPESTFSSRFWDFLNNRGGGK